MPRIERTNEKYNRGLVKEFIRSDLLPPEKTVSNLDELLEYLIEEDEKPTTPL